MDGPRFDLLVQSLAIARPRRRLTHAILGGVLGIALGPAATGAGPGCTNVGKPCKKPGDCCSGKCKGKQDKKTCRAHDATTCVAGEVGPQCGGKFKFCETSSQLPGVCRTTTGKAGYCEYIGTDMPCTKDKDCHEGFGPGAACLKCPSAPSGTRCARPEPA
jgi:hypothetical protein